MAQCGTSTDVKTQSRQDRDGLMFRMNVRGCFAAHSRVSSAAIEKPMLTKTLAQDVRLPGSWILFIPAAMSIIYALDIHMGTYDVTAIPWLIVAGALMIVAVAISRVAIWQGSVVGIMGILLGIAVLFDFGIALRSLPVHQQVLTAEAKSDDNIFAFFSGMGVAAVLAGAVASGRPFLRRAAFPGLLIAFLGLSIWIVNNTRPTIDVFTFQRDSTSALMHGENPYTLTFPDPYNGRSPWYGKGLSVNGRLQFGYPYFPLSLLMAVPGHWAGDIRYAQAVAVVLAGALIGYAGNSRMSFAAACLFMFMSRSFWVIEESWIEPFVVLTLALLAFSARRLPRFMPYALGLFFATKQYLPLAAPLALLLCDWPLRWRQVWGVAWRALLAASVVTLPLALWNWSAFWHSTVQVQMAAPFRPDGLSMISWLYDPDGGGAVLPAGQQPSAAIAFVMLLLAMILSLACAPRNIAGFCGSASVCFLAFFAFNKQAFMNYYFFVIGAIACAIAAAAPLEAPVIGGSMPER
jgi:hypothetical protein